MQPARSSAANGPSEIATADPVLLQADLADVVHARITAAQLTTFFVVLGVVVRLVRFLLAFPLSADEYQLAVSLLDRGFPELLQPLGYNQVAPIGFLWIELAVVRLCGFSELSLRLFPVVCGIGSLLLFRRVAGRLLRGLPLVIAVAIFAVSYYPIRYSAEVKPYASDAFLSLFLFWLVVEWWRAPDESRWLWCLTAAAPLSLAVSFPAAFVCGGLSLGIAYSFWRRRLVPCPDKVNGRSSVDFSPQVWTKVHTTTAQPMRDKVRARLERISQLAWVAFNFAVAAAFLGLMQLNISAQLDKNSHDMTDCWGNCFPPWRQPWQLVSWLANVHTSEMFAYPIGAEHGGSLLTSLCFFVALWSAIRQPQREVAVTVAGWFGLSLIAAALHCYPYGGHARLSQYLAPSICLLAGSGAGMLLARLRRREWQIGAVRFVLAACVAIAAGTLARDVYKPYKDRVDRDHREFARRFWNAAPGERTVCLLTDLGVEAYEGTWNTAYLCNQRIYSPWHHDGSRSHEHIPDDGLPLRCVAYHSLKSRRLDKVFTGWMQEMLSKYDLAGKETYEIPLTKACDLMCYDVYYFTPKVKIASSGSTARTD